MGINTICFHYCAYLIQWRRLIAVQLWFWIEIVSLYTENEDYKLYYKNPQESIYYIILQESIADFKDFLKSRFSGISSQVSSNWFIRGKQMS